MIKRISSSLFLLLCLYKQLLKTCLRNACEYTHAQVIEHPKLALMWTHPNPADLILLNDSDVELVFHSALNEKLCV